MSATGLDSEIKFFFAVELQTAVALQSGGTTAEKTVYNDTQQSTQQSLWCVQEQLGQILLMLPF